MTSTLQHHNPHEATKPPYIGGMSNQQKKQTAWKTMLIIGIVATAIWLFTGSSDNAIDQFTRTLAGGFAIVGLLAGTIMFIQSRKD